MRVVGQLADEQQARRFSDFLYAEGIDNTVEDDGAGNWVVWIHSEDELEAGSGHLRLFEQDPGASRYVEASRLAALKREQALREETDYSRKVHDAQEAFRGGGWRGSMGPLTLTLVGLSILVFFVSGFGAHTSRVATLYFSNPMAPRGAGAFEEVLRGEVWRLFTPVFIHMSFLHILFNVLCLLDLGGVVESREGTARYGLLLLTIAVLSNLAQYVVSGPLFGGLSGLVYGLFGFVWIRGRCDPLSGYFLSQSTVVVMLVWLGMGLMLPGMKMANTVHLVGLGVGMAWGFFSAYLRRD